MLRASDKPMVCPSCFASSSLYIYIFFFFHLISFQAFDLFDLFSFLIDETLHVQYFIESYIRSTLIYFELLSTTRTTKVVKIDNFFYCWIFYRT